MWGGVSGHKQSVRGQHLTDRVRQVAGEPRRGRKGAGHPGRWGGAQPRGREGGWDRDDIVTPAGSNFV